MMARIGPAEEGQVAAAPADAAEVAQAVAHDERQQDQSGPDEAVKGESAGENR